MIKIGDFVRVYFARDWILEGEVIYSPLRTGDSWQIRQHGLQNGTTHESGDGTIHYVQIFMDMHKI